MRAPVQAVVGLEGPSLSDENEMELEGRGGGITTLASVYCLLAAAAETGPSAA